MREILLAFIREGGAIIIACISTAFLFFILSRYWVKKIVFEILVKSMRVRYFYSAFEIK